MQVEITTITPQMAKDMLQANTRNRKISKPLVEGYARDIINGDWHLNGETFKIAEDGAILDGQHRLMAIIEADQGVRTLLVTGLPTETQSTMDTGRKRTISDDLTINGVGYAVVVAAVALRMWMWDAGDTKMARTVRPTPSEQRAWIAANPAVHRAAEVATRVRQGFPVVPQSTVGVAHVLFNRIDPSDTAEFFAHFQTGGGLEDGHPILRLRDRFVRDAMDNRKHTDAVKLGLVIKAWNATRKGERPGGLQMTHDNKMPLPE